MHIHVMKCFGLRAGEGNTALVVEGAPAGAAGRQAFARARNAGACVFVDASDDPRAAQVLDFYYPHMPSPLCLHATLGAARVLFARQPNAATITVKTAQRGQYLQLSRGAGDLLYVGLARQEPTPLAIAPELAAALLGVAEGALACAPLVASVGSPKLLVELRDIAALRALRPRLEPIVEWGKRHGVNGCYVYCRSGEDRFEGRNFNHLDAALEDSATGVAAGALTALLGRAITVYQGAATGQACVIRTRIEGDTILIGGAASLIR